jgi:hypothetical protein
MQCHPQLAPAHLQPLNVQVLRNLRVNRQPFPMRSSFPYDFHTFVQSPSPAPAPWHLRKVIKYPGSSVHPCVPCGSRFSLVLNQGFPET